jgi:hypothetical protein
LWGRGRRIWSLKPAWSHSETLSQKKKKKKKEKEKKTKPGIGDMAQAVQSA